MSRHALWPSAQAIQLLPTPVGPVMSRFLLAADPVTIDELGEEGALDAARRAQIDILDDCGLAQASELQARDEPFVVPLGDLAIDHQAEPLLEGERGDIGLALLIVEGFGHAGEPEGGEAFMGVVDEHEVSFLLVSGSSRGRGCCRAGWDRRRGRESGRKALSRPVLRMEAIER